MIPTGTILEKLNQLIKGRKILMSKFKREDRYLVLKIKDVEAYLSDCEKECLSEILSTIHLSRKTPQKASVIIECDWPEYEIVWAMIKARINKEDEDHTK